GRGCSLGDSESDASVSIDIANRPGWTSRGVNDVGLVWKESARFPFASTSHARTRRPRWDASRASAAATVVLPTPPLPVTKTSLRSRSSTTSALLGAETDVALLVGTADLEVREPLGRDADPPPAPVGQPEHLVVAADRGLDLGGDLVA